MKRAAAILLVLALSAHAGEGEALVAKLGAESWRDREAAMFACLDKPDLRPLLEEAARGADDEAAWRARWVLGCLDWGIDGTLARAEGNPFENAEALSDEELQLGVAAVMRDPRPQRLAVLIAAARRFPEGAAQKAALGALRAPVEGDCEWAAARLGSGDTATRTGAALVLAWRGDKRGAEALKADLASGKPAFGRDIAIDALIALGDPAGLASLVDAVKAAIAAKTPPGPEDLQKIAQAPIGLAEAEAVLLAALEGDYGAAAGAEQARDAALDGLARCGGPAAAARLGAWWEGDPDARHHALTVAASLADPPVLRDLAARAQAKLAGDGAKPEKLFLAAALHRLAGNRDEHRALVDRLADSEDLPAGEEGIAEVVLTRIEDGRAGDALALLKKAIKKTGDPDGTLALLAAGAAKAAGEDASAFRPWPNYNNGAWMLVTHPERLAHPGLAVRMAEHTVGADPDLAHRGTLGASYYRAGRFEDSVKTLEQNLEPYYFGKEEDMAFLVMSYKKLGRDADAAKVEAQCREWEAKSAKPNPLRPEMERVLRQR